MSSVDLDHESPYGASSVVSSVDVSPLSGPPSVPSSAPPSGVILDWQDIFSERGADGFTRLYSMTTGEVVGVVGDDARRCISIPSRELVREDGTRIIYIGESAEDYSAKAESGNSFPFTRYIAEEICHLIAGGSSLSKLCSRDDMPSISLVSRWRRTFPEFGDMVRLAYEDQADYLADLATDKSLDLELSEDLSSERIHATKLLVDTIKWRTSVQKPRVYSPRQTISGDPSSPLQIIVDTGIRRDGDAGYNRDESLHSSEARVSSSGVSLVGVSGDIDVSQE